MLTISRKRVLACLLVAMFAPLTASAEESSAQTERPNIVILLADDLGWNDVSYHGSPIKTPHIDRLAAEGVELDRFYVCPVCSPTRAGLMTGRWPIRYGLMRAVIPPWRDFGLRTEEVTLADMLAQAGYHRRAAIGKWHLGHWRKKYHPLSRGFTYFYGHYNGAIDYFTHQREGELDWHRGFQPSYDQGYSTDLLAEEAVRFIEESPAGEPFFLYVPFNAVHAPFQATEEALSANAHIANPNRRKLAAMVTSMDQAIGRILGAMERRKIVDDTFVLFFSDNGGVAKPTGNNDPLRGRKATVFEGGIRVAAALRWPAGIEGGHKVTAPMANIDIFPTLQAVVGADQHAGKPLDGINMLEVIRGRAEAPQRELFSYIGQRDEESEQICVITPQWKLVCIGPNILKPAGASARELLLLRIDQDPYEQRDLAEQHPDVVKRLLERLKEFRALQPPDGVVPYSVGRQGFKAPKEWAFVGED